MAVRQTICYIAVCDLCGAIEGLDGCETHAPTVQDMIDIVTDKWGPVTSGWTHTVDGQLVCDIKSDALHRTAHEEAGKYISGCAMTVHYGPDSPN